LCTRISFVASTETSATCATLKDGRVFHDYEVLRLSDMPEVSVTILESEEKMGGIGEPAAAPISAAVANAVYALTKQRLRSLPLRLA